jgi:NodT family efflux transporter outer membrane factor (OMF) lipoprotein
MATGSTGNAVSVDSAVNVDIAVNADIAVSADRCECQTPTCPTTVSDESCPDVSDESWMWRSRKLQEFQPTGRSRNADLSEDCVRRCLLRCVGRILDVAKSEAPEVSDDWASSEHQTHRARRLPIPALTALSTLSALLLGCSVGPNYRPAAAPVPATYKELKGWKVAAPNDTIDRGAWWSIYRDPTLDGLEWQIDVSNQNIKQFEAAYREARAEVREQQSSFFPSLSVTPQIDRQKGNRVITTSYSLEGNATWEPDLWGKVRRNVESSVANAQATAAQLAAARLSAQAQLATDYFELRYADSLKDLLDETVKGFQRSLQITQNQYAAGTVARSDVITAQTQLLSAQAQEINVGVQRAQFEHAIALLIGRPPADLTIPPVRLPNRVPIVPTSVPSTLLERRPDIAEAERQMQQENALIGVQVAAYFPTINLSAAFGYVGNPMTGLITASNQVWSIAASASETVLSGGQRSAAVAVARANYDRSVANYRQVVLAAFQNVEDELSSLRVLAEQIQVEDAAVQSAKRAVEISLNEYQAGTIPYTTVITAQTTLLSDQESALLVQENRLIASVALVEALGGGWDTSQLPNKLEIQIPHLVPD